MVAMQQTKDADGVMMEIGSDVRLRLSRLDVHGVDVTERNGMIESISADGNYVSAFLNNGNCYTFATNEVRVNAPEVDEDGDTNYEPVGPVATDADGRELFIGSAVRVRLSRLAALNVSRENRHGFLFAVTPNGQLGVHLTNDRTEGLYATSAIRKD